MVVGKMKIVVLTDYWQMRHTSFNRLALIL
jgi:hypothetical protein